MAELDGQATATETVVDTTDAGTTDAPSLVSVDGTFSKDWVNGLEEDVKSDKGLSTFKNVKDLAKSYVNARRMIGKEKVAIPNEKSTPAEWEAYYEAGGRPKTSGDYKLDYPKDMPVPEQPELRKAYMELAHKNGISNKQATALYEFYNGIVKQSVVAQQQQEELQMKEADEKLKTVWGKAYEQKIHFGNVAVEQAVNGDEELKIRLTDKFGNDPDFIMAMSNLGDKFAEHRTISQNVPTPGDIQTKINDLMATPAYMNRDNPGHKVAVEMVQRLFVEKNKNSSRQS
jgi:hypothetical protein